MTFNHFSVPQNVLPVQHHFTSPIELSADQKSNLTLFNPSLTAKPIQLKSILNTVYQEYRGPYAPDRFSQPAYPYRSKCGVFFRNFENRPSSPTAASSARSLDSDAPPTPRAGMKQQQSLNLDDSKISKSIQRTLDTHRGGGGGSSQ